MKKQSCLGLTLSMLVACTSREPVSTLHVEYTGLPVTELQCTLRKFAEEEGFRISEGKDVPQVGVEPKFFYYFDTDSGSPAAAHNIKGVGRLIIYIYSETAPLKNGKAQLEPLFEELSREVQSQRVSFAGGGESPQTNCVVLDK